MVKEQVVQFVHFETKLDREAFITQWEQYSRLVNHDLKVTLQQCRKNNYFQYIAQHRCAADEFDFVFEKRPRTRNNFAAEPIRVERLGGYRILLSERESDLRPDERKILVFLSNTKSGLDTYRSVCSEGKLNIYEAYYENSRYAYILEFFVKKDFAPKSMDLLAQFHPAEIGIYEEYRLEMGKAVQV
jgi:hypothetical protein